MTPTPIDDVIYGGTPLETHWAGVHPRLHFGADDLTRLRPKLARDPWKPWLAALRQCAEKSPLHQAFLFALCREPEALQRASQSIATLLEKPSSAFCSDYSLACAYDWLYADLDPALRTRLQTFLDTRLRPEYEAFAKHEVYTAGTVGWNISSEHFANLAAAGFALYGDVPKVAPWVRFITEKARVVTQALGPDGVSSEGICYGGFFTETYIKTLDLVHRLMGVDLFAENDYLRNLPFFYLYTTLPRKQLRPGNSVLCLGDGAPWHWYGPSSYLHKIAAYYRDPIAQAVAQQHRQAGASVQAASLYDLLWFDPTVPARLPARLPLSRHFTDKDIVAFRSDWKGDESVLLFKCGPHGGHKALQQYPQCIAGGHMAPDAGSLLLFAHGERLIGDGGYAKKYTAYRNTVLVNGIGQTGECDGTPTSEWFECSDLRREKRGPSLLRVDLDRPIEYLIGQVAPAYKPEARLTRFLRHLFYLRPDTWVLIDELTAEIPSTFELWFHSHCPPHGKPEHPFQPVGDQAWETVAPNGRCRIAALSPQPIDAEPGLQSILGIGAHVNHEIDVLRLRNPKPLRSALFVTVLDALAPRQNRPRPLLERQGNRYTLRLTAGSRRHTLRFQPGRKDPAQSILLSAR